MSFTAVSRRHADANGLETIAAPHFSYRHSSAGLQAAKSDVLHYYNTILQT